ncbi:MAG: chemotaxis protein CheB [Sedimentisphaerales bacterium]
MPRKKKIIPANHKTTSFPIVGVGASAGGLEAYQELLRNLPAKPGMAFVFIMHLAPEHKSLLPELLVRLTKMPVSEIKNGMPIEVNHVYVKPPNTNLSIAGGKLILSERKDSDFKHMPIDHFFRSLADELGNRAIGVILSGTATDGTLGAEAIKAEGGITFAQDEKSAKYDGMPQSAIAAGCVDFVLSPKRIASELERIAKHPLISFAGSVKTDKSIITKDKGIESIFDILRSARGQDFTHYKTPTISRRIARRIVLLKLENLRGYIKFLRENKDEVEKLYDDLLINVTSFFRDPKVFDALKKQVLPAILKNRSKNQGVRVWVPACSSGEEAYSIAICLCEVLGNKASAVPVQIFSTDVRDDSINKARRGIYGKNIKNSITPERLKRFFTKTGDSYQVSKQLREMCIFSKQNVFSDPPFSNLDLISCRNLLIYLQPVLQKKVFHNFHYALRPGGFLLLGNAEAAGGYSNLFKTLDGKHRIFAKKYLSAGPELEFVRKYYPSSKLEIKEKTDIKKGKEADVESVVERIVLDEYAPCGALIDSDMKVVQFRGHTGCYLESAAGKPSHDIFKLAREGLLMPLRAAIYKARETKHTVKREADSVLYNGRRMRVKITVVPVESGPLKEKFFLVLFDEIAGSVSSKNLPKACGKHTKDEKYVESLQKELSETKEYLRTVIEEQESANEEVKTANEEILSSNEELQSTNEELETAKEELQSSNEELVTTNEELQKRNIESSLLNNDLVNLLGSINMPVVMMGTDLVIRRVTPQAEKALNIISSDAGRPISKIKLNVDIPNFEKMLLDVIETHHPKTFEIKDREETWYSVNIRPYRALNNKIDGVVAIFVDITERKKAQQVIEDARAYAESIVETMRASLIVLDIDLKVISANRSFYRTFKVDHKETHGRFIYDLGNRQWSIPKLRELLREVLVENKDIDNYEIEHNFETIGLKTMLFSARRLISRKMILITIEDITERKKVEMELKKANEELIKFNDLKDEFVSMASHELRTPLSIIIGAVKLVLDQIPGKIVPEQKEILETAMNNLGRLTRIVDALLDMSKIESGKIELHKEDIDIRELIEETVGECRLRAEEKGIHIGFRVPEQPLDLCIDGDKIKQVLMNLISNGLKFTPAGGSIEVECVEEPKEVQLSVSDTGCGIAEQNMPRLFEKFAQFDRKVGPGEKGTGLGLAISKGLVNLHKGRIWAKSQAGKGTVFTFALPRLDSRDIVNELLEQAVRQAVKNNANAGVIVMSVKAKGQEDEKQVQRMLKEIHGLVEQNLRRGVDKTVMINHGELAVVLADCSKEDLAAIKMRHEQTLMQYLADNGLCSQVEPSIKCAVYPQDGHTTEELLSKVEWTDMVGAASSNP